MSKFHSILGVPASATKDQIKKAYRNKARQYHPDVNKSSDAHEKFIEISEAYECLTNHPSHKKIYRSRKVSKEELERIQREKARKRAAYYANMRYKQFTQTAYYKKSQAANVLFDHIHFLISLIIMSAPLFGYYIFGGQGIISGAVLAFFTIPFWAKIFSKDFSVNFKDLFDSFKIIAKTQTFWILIVTAINVFLIFRIIFNTLIQLEPLVITILILYLPLGITHYFEFKLFPKSYRGFINICLLPGVFNLFFLFNYVFSSNSHLESYLLTQKRGNSMVYLENNAYGDYMTIRCFADFEEINNSNRINYRFADGLWGIKVLKSYEFGQ